MSRAEQMTYEEAHERLTYDPETGRFWIKKHPRCASLSGRETKCLDVSGYIQINLKPYGPIKGHRVAWLMHYGSWPVGQIDHINGIRNDNRIENLRVVTNAINTQNKRQKLPSNKSGFMGVTLAYNLRDGTPRWLASLSLNRRTYRFGVHPTPELAHAAYLKAKREMHPGCTL